MQSPTGEVPASVVEEIRRVAPDTSLEVMATKAAVATHNILVGEGRSVVSALLV